MVRTGRVQRYNRAYICGGIGLTDRASRAGSRGPTARSTPPTRAGRRPGTDCARQPPPRTRQARQHRSSRWAPSPTGRRPPGRTPGPRPRSGEPQRTSTRAPPQGWNGWVTRTVRDPPWGSGVVDGSGQRNSETLDPHAAARMPGQHADHRSAPPRGGAAGVPRALRHAPPAPIAPSASTRRPHRPALQTDCSNCGCPILRAGLLTWWIVVEGAAA
jgi:hypothetical protein